MVSLLSRNILLLGGAGYVGSHIALEAVKSGFKVLVLDNFQNSKPQLIESLQQKFPRQISVIQGDATASDWSESIDLENIDAVVHLVGRKSVAESFLSPFEYLQNNVMSTKELLRVLDSFKHLKWVYSSSCTVYAPSVADITESSALGPISPYGQTKMLSETLLLEYLKEVAGRGVCLRYFNPIGAAISGGIGEHSTTAPLMIIDSIFEAILRGTPFRVNGSTFNTRDGSPERDYVDVNDIAKAHIIAINKLVNEEPISPIMNLGTGRGTTVLELCRVVTEVTGIEVEVTLGPPREGDAPRAVASPRRANSELLWSADRPIVSSIESAWQWATTRRVES